MPEFASKAQFCRHFADQRWANRVINGNNLMCCVLCLQYLVGIARMTTRCWDWKIQKSTSRFTRNLNFILAHLAHLAHWHIGSLTRPRVFAASIALCYNSTTLNSHSQVTRLYEDATSDLFVSSPVNLFAECVFCPLSGLNHLSNPCVNSCAGHTNTSGYSPGYGTAHCHAYRRSIRYAIPHHSGNLSNGTKYPRCAGG